jgi:hypothetical protein
VPDVPVLGCEPDPEEAPVVDPMPGQWCVDVLPLLVDPLELLEPPDEDEPLVVLAEPEVPDEDVVLAVVAA